MKISAQVSLMARFGWRHWVLFCVVVVIVTVLTALRIVFGNAIGVADFATIAGIFLTLGYFIIQEHRETTRFFHELFCQFNNRYDAMNDQLQVLCNSNKPLDAQAKMKFIDYFNLCAEENLLYRMGYIPNVVWNAWYKGMETYGKNEHVADLWQSEIQSQLENDEDLTFYYGFRFPCPVVSKDIGKVFRS